MKKIVYKITIKNSKRYLILETPKEVSDFLEEADTGFEHNVEKVEMDTSVLYSLDEFDGF